jgi:hypothetical protein
MAAFPLPRRSVNPALRQIIRASNRLSWQIALAAGIRHYPKFSELINAETVPATQINIDRLNRIADAVGFDRSLLFVDGER